MILNLIEIKDVIELIQNENCLYQSKYAELHVEHLYTVETNATFLVFVRSYNFTGTYSLCMQNEQIEDYLSKLQVLDSSLEGRCKISDTDSDAYLTLEFENRDLKVFGQLGGSYEENYMKFSFLADQTLVKLLMNKLSGSLNN